MPERRKPRRPHPYLHVRLVDGLLTDQALAVTGNRAALLKLREQIDRVLEERNDWYPFDDELYRDVYEEQFQVVVKRASRREEMREPVPKPEKTAEELPWAELARRTAERHLRESGP